jgi:hypothetical protein
LQVIKASISWIDLHVLVLAADLTSKEHRERISHLITELDYLDHVGKTAPLLIIDPLYAASILLPRDEAGESSLEVEAEVC